VPAFYSPYTARLLAPVPKPPAHRVAGAIEPFADLDHQVDEVFFGGARFESMRPVVTMACPSDDARHVKLMSQLAVLLFDEDPAPSFSLIGRVGAVSLKRLKAAKVEVVDLPDVFDRAIKLQTASVFVAVGTAPGFPLAVAEAMASGVPCVAIDSVQHRRLLRHGKTGFICHSFEDLLAHVAQLLHSADLRARIGEAARADALLRFTPRVFRQSLLSAYQLGNHIGNLSS